MGDDDEYAADGFEESTATAPAAATPAPATTETDDYENESFTEPPSAADGGASAAQQSDGYEDDFAESPAKQAASSNNNNQEEDYEPAVSSAAGNDALLAAHKAASDAQARADAAEAEASSMREQIAALEAKAAQAESALEAARAAEERRSTQAATGSKAQLEEKLFGMSEQLVKAGEQHMKLSQKTADQTARLKLLEEDVASVRGTLLEGIAGAGADGKHYQHVKLYELLRLRLQQDELSRAEAAAPGVAGASSSRVGSASVPARAGSAPKGKHVTSAEVGGAAGEAVGAIKQLEDEKAALAAAKARLASRVAALEEELRGSLTLADDVRVLKGKCASMLENARREKEARLRADANTTLASKKVLALSDHIEKLMLHLKHEAAAKAKAHDAAGRAAQESALLRARNAAMQRKTATREKVIIELREGAKILEDQLRLMDSKYIELRTKLDWTRQHASREVLRSKAQVSSLRAKWALATNSQMGLLDEVRLEGLDGSLGGMGGGLQSAMGSGPPTLGSLGQTIPTGKKTKKGGSLAKSKSAGGGALRPNTTVPDQQFGGGGGGAMRPASSMPSFGGGADQPAAEPWEDTAALGKLMGTGGRR